jgi:hypothetical protein
LFEDAVAGAERVAGDGDNERAENYELLGKRTQGEPPKSFGLRRKTVFGTARIIAQAFWAEAWV